jgi:ABC-type nitrate/sulfonate/bicarbonate transport system substrate-binding protein
MDEQNRGIAQAFGGALATFQRWTEEVSPEERADIQRELTEFKQHFAQAYTLAKETGGQLVDLAHEASDDVIAAFMIGVKAWQDAEAFLDADERKTRTIKRLLPPGKCRTTSDLAQHVTVG